VGWRWCSRGEAQGTVGARARWARGEAWSEGHRRSEVRGVMAAVAALGLT
jgi:hypothetical protein